METGLLKRQEPSEFFPFGRYLRACSSILASFLDILNKHAPVTTIKVKGNSLPYVTSELRALIKTRDYLRTNANKTGSECLRQAFNHTRNKVNKLLSDLQKTYYSKKIEENKNNLKGTWKIFKEAMGQESKHSTIEKLFIKDVKSQTRRKLQISAMSTLFLLEKGLQ